MNQILALREKRAKAWEAAKAFLESKRGTDGLLSAEENCSTVNVSSLRSVKVATPPCAANAAIPCGLAVRKQHNCCSPPASLKKPNTEN